MFDSFFIPFILSSRLAKTTVVTLIAIMLGACANTTLTESWKEPSFNNAVKHPMIIGISDSQQTRQIYEKYFIEALKKKNIDATASYTLISSKQKITKETVVDAISDTDIDGVFVTYLVANDHEVKHRDSPVNGGYSTDVENLMSSTLILNRGRSTDSEKITLKNDLYSVARKELVWSAQTLTVAPESIDEVIKDVTELLLSKMLSDDVLQKVE